MAGFSYALDGHPIGCKGWAERWVAQEGITPDMVDAITLGHLEDMLGHLCSMCKAEDEIRAMGFDPENL